MAKRARGFTLIELMIVLTVVGILAAVAIPTFNAQMRKSRRSEMIAELQRLTLEQEKWRASNVSYGSTVQVVPGTMANYDVAYSNLSATRFTLTATAKVGNGQNYDSAGGSSCATLSIDSTNGTQSKSPAACFK